MEIKIINNKKTWEDFLLDCEDKTFLNSWNWGEFQVKMGNKIWRLGVFEKEKILATALVSRILAKRGKFFLIQHGPIIKDKNQRKEALGVLLKELKIMAKKEGVHFIRINPLWEDNKENKDILKDLEFRLSPMHANAYEATWRLNIALPEEELFKNMRKTTRYLVRQAKNNKDIEIEISKEINDISKYQKINKETARRQKFTSFSLEYIQNEFEIFSKDNQVLWFFGKYKGKITCASLIIFWSNIAFYHQAASDANYKKFSIPYLLQWEAIKEAKRRGCNIYDFWGFVDPKKHPKHPWAGPTLFKMGFGGFSKEYIKTQDYPLSPFYKFSFLIEKIRSIKRFGV